MCYSSKFVLIIALNSAVIVISNAMLLEYGCIYLYTLQVPTLDAMIKLSIVTSVDFFSHD